jgi:hypothetical protein
VRVEEVDQVASIDAVFVTALESNVVLDVELPKSFVVLEGKI